MKKLTGHKPPVRAEHSVHQAMRSAGGYSSLTCWNLSHGEFKTFGGFCLVFNTFDTIHMFIFSTLNRFSKLLMQCVFSSTFMPFFFSFFFFFFFLFFVSFFITVEAIYTCVPLFKSLEAISTLGPVFETFNAFDSVDTSSSFCFLSFS